MQNQPLFLFRLYSFAILSHTIQTLHQPLKTKIEVVHFSWPDEISFDEKTIEAAFKKQFKYGLKLHFEKNDGVHSLIENLQNQIRIRKPSVVGMFTNQKRTFFQKLFLARKS